MFMDEVNFNVGRRRLAATYALLGVSLAAVIAFGVVSAGATRGGHHRKSGYGGCQWCTTTTRPGTTTTLHEQGSTTTTTAPTGSTTTTTTNGSGPLPHTGSGTEGPFMFGVSCIAGGALLAIRRRRSVVSITPR